MANQRKAIDKRNLRRRAGWRSARRISFVITVVLLVCTAAMAALRWRQWSRFRRADELVEQALKAELRDLARIREEMASHRQWVDRLLDARYRKLAPGSPQRVRIGLVSESWSEAQLQEITAALLKATPSRQQLLLPLVAGRRETLAPPCWRVLEDSQARPAARLRAACALSGLGETDPSRWKNVAPVIARQAVKTAALDHSQFQSLTALLHGAADSLLAQLWALVESEDIREPTRQVAAQLLAEFVPDDPQQLIDLMAVVDGETANQLAQRLAPLEKKVKRLYQSNWSQPLTVDWGDRPLENVHELDAKIMSLVESAGGFTHSRFAFCVNLKLSECEMLIEKMGEAGYRPRRLRPYETTNGPHVAILWMRDALPWKMQLQASGKEIRQTTNSLRDQGYQPEDIAMYRTKEGVEFAAIWIKPDAQGGAAEIYASASANDYETKIQDLRRKNLQPLTSHALRVNESQAAYSTVWKPGGRFQTRSKVSFPIIEMLLGGGWLPVDVCPLTALPLEDTASRYTRRLKQAEERLEKSESDVSARYSRGLAYFYLEKRQSALDDINWVIDQRPNTITPYRIRAVLHARLGNASQARQDLDEYFQRSSSESTKAYVKALVEAHSTNPRKALEQYNREANWMESGFVYDAACVYSLLSAMVAEKDAGQSSQYDLRAVRLLNRAVILGYRNYAHMAVDPDLDPIRALEEFKKIMQGANTAWEYSCALVEPDGMQGEILPQVPTAQHLKQAQELIDAGYRMTSIAALQDPGAVQPMVTSVWHRPAIRHEARRRQALRRAAAAALLAKNGFVDSAWALFSENAPAQQRSRLIQNLAALSVPANHLIEKVQQTDNASQLAAVLLALGNYSDSQFDATRRDAMLSPLLTLYREHADREVHAAVKWLLTSWSKGEDLAAIDDELASPETTSKRNWQINNQRQTMILFHGPIEFRMGSPNDENGRGAAERLHRRRIERSFSIADVPVTRSQFEQFLNNRGSFRFEAPSADGKSDDRPQTRVTWFAAAAYCNWLSEQEGIPENQWCYQPNDQGEYARGMKPAADYLRRRGYRLPSEAEWEYACRAGSESARPFGDSDDLLADYAWYWDNALLDGPRPVGRLKPNRYGLFDMLGNVWEWCHERHGHYPPGPVVVDEGDIDNVAPTESRMLRGGAYSGEPKQVRSACRSLVRPGKHSRLFGFRVARTEFFAETH